MKYLRAFRRILILIAHILDCLILLTIKIRGLEQRAPTVKEQHEIQKWMNKTAKILNSRIDINGRLPDQPCLIVCNHISWLDIIILSSRFQATFLSKAEVMEWPVFGILAKKSGTIFLRRGGKKGIEEAIEKVTQALKDKRNVVVFPEGTTTRGEDIKNFHPRIFAAAINTEIPILPIAIHYPYLGGVTPHIPFVDDDNLISSLIKILGLPNIKAQLNIGPMLNTKNADRKKLATQSMEFIRRKIKSDSYESTPKA